MNVQSLKSGAPVWVQELWDVEGHQGLMRQVEEAAEELDYPLGYMSEGEASTYANQSTEYDLVFYRVQDEDLRWVEWTWSTDTILQILAWMEEDDYTGHDSFWLG
ncbi:hypothetical protein [Salininema proteolyticum]|uniref:Uncharacterized protein n=1 Tax=Salininema proteolyticum TaxID=1607685 RepID=A0ABV8TZ20_9ACTN